MLPFPTSLDIFDTSGLSHVTFVEHLALLLAQACDDVVIVARDSAQMMTLTALPLITQLSTSCVRVIHDSVADTGPLMGLHTGLSAIRHSHALVTAVDMPLVRPALIAFLLASPRTNEIIFPIVEDVPQVLLALYPRSILPIVEERLHAGRRDPRSLLDVAPVRYIEEAQLRVVDSELRSFVNVNTPGEYEML